MDALITLPKDSVWWAWMVLLLATIGTYLWRGLGVALSGKINQDGLIFRWITCVTYAMVAALVIRIIVLPVGLLAQMPLSYRLIATGAALVVMMGRKNALVPALVTGTFLTAFFGWLSQA